MLSPAPSTDSALQLLRELLDGSREAAIALDHEMRIVAVNRTWARFVGLTQQDLLGQDLRQLLRGELREVFADPTSFIDDLLQSYTAGTHMAGLECRISASAKRRERWVEHRSRPIETGPWAGGRCEYLSDVSERRGAEGTLRERLRSEQEALRRSEIRYRRLFEQSKDVVYISMPEGRLIDINQAGLDLLGYPSKQEALLANLADVYIDPLQRRALMQEVAKNGYAKDFELRLQTRLGEPKVVHGTASAVRDESGELSAVLGILRDVTEQRQLEDQLRQSQKMEAIGRLAGGLAHDFNNLLTAINGYSQLLARIVEDDIQLTYVEEILQAGRRASDLTSKLLALSRRQVTHPKEVDLNEVIHGLKKLLQQLIGEDIELVTELEPEIGRVRVDQGQIEQVLLNMAVNARDAMPTGGRLVFATKLFEGAALRAVSAGAPPLPGEPQTPLDGPFVRISVTDTGTGIPEDVLPHIFEPFFTTKDGEKGTGLGLSTAYATVSQNGGFLEVESAEGDGTTFHIDLPSIDGGTTESPLDETIDPVHRGEGVILLVEDNDGVRALVRELLEQHGYTVIEASQADEAMQRADERGATIDLLVSDVVMPGMSGPELATKLLDRFPSLKILFITGYAGSFISQHGLSDAYPVMQKPLDIQHLARKVRQILEA